MMIPLKETFAKYGIQPKGVIVVGAHWAEEHNEFLKCGIKGFVYIEPSKESFREMVRTSFCFNLPEGSIPEWVFNSGNSYLSDYQGDIGVIAVTNFNVACAEKEGNMVMYVSHQNQGQSNSLLKPELHTKQHPEIIFDDAEVVKVVTLDSLPIKKEEYDFLYMDVQGAEGLVLKGATETLKHIKVIYTEVNRGQTYSGNMEIEEMDRFLSDYGFKRVETYWPSPNWTWGDSIYILQK